MGSQMLGQERMHTVLCITLFIVLDTWPSIILPPYHVPVLILPQDANGSCCYICGWKNCSSDSATLQLLGELPGYAKLTLLDMNW